MNIGLIVRLLLTSLLVIEASGVFILGMALVAFASSEDFAAMLGASPAYIVLIFLVALVIVGGAVAMWLRPRGGTVQRFWSATLLLLTAGANVLLLGFGMILEWGPLVGIPLFALLLICAELWFGRSRPMPTPNHTPTHPLSA